MTHRSQHVVRVGSVYRPNDSQWAFEVYHIGVGYAYVHRLGGGYPRRIRLADLHPSGAKHGYSLLELAPSSDGG